MVAEFGCAGRPIRDSEFSMTGPDRLIRWRKRRGLTQAQAAQMFKVSASSLCDYERGRKLPGVRVALRIARVARIPVLAWEPDSQGAA